MFFNFNSNWFDSNLKYKFYKLKHKLYLICFQRISTNFTLKTAWYNPELCALRFPIAFNMLPNLSSIKTVASLK